MSTKDSLYKDGFWYNNTYDSLGSDWLIDSLMKQNLRKNYVLVNLSANEGKYEEDAYKWSISNNFLPKYYIGDLIGLDLYKNKKDYKRFIFLHCDKDVYDIAPSYIPKKADIIIDCKGAIWHSLSNKELEKQNLIKLLTNYKDLLRTDESIILIDYYKLPYIKYLINNVKYHFSNSNYKERQIKYFGERSTYECLQDLFGKHILNELIIPLHINKYNINYPLTRHMDTAVITKDNLIELIELTNDFPLRKFNKAKSSRTKKEFIGYLIILSPIGIITFILLCLILKIIFYTLL